MQHDILITDLTQMRRNNFCIAGVTPKGVTVRPDISHNTIQEKHLIRNNQPIIRPRAVLRMDLQSKSSWDAPHTEDRDWINPDETEFLRLATEQAWKIALQRTLYESVHEIFETELYDNKRIEPGTGVRSLGTIRSESVDGFIYQPDMFERGKYRYRLSFTQADGQCFEDLPITDLALRYYADYLRLHDKISCDDIQAMLLSSFQTTEIWLRLGLTRPFQKKRDDDSWCYLQVNGIYTFPDYLEGRCFADFRLD